MRAIYVEQEKTHCSNTASCLKVKRRRLSSMNPKAVGLLNDGLFSPLDFAQSSFCRASVAIDVCEVILIYSCA